MSRKKRRLKRGAKAACQRRHAALRAEQRFGVELTRKVLEGLLRQIRKGESVVVCRQSRRVVLHRVILGEETAIAVYDRARKTIASLLYEESDPRWNAWPGRSNSNPPGDAAP